MAAALLTPSSRIAPVIWRFLLSPCSGPPMSGVRGNKAGRPARITPPVYAGFKLPAPARSLAMAYGPAWEREHAYEHQPLYEQGMSAIVRFTILAAALRGGQFDDLGANRGGCDRISLQWRRNEAANRACSLESGEYRLNPAG